MRISDWSSDVCSSDLAPRASPPRDGHADRCWADGSRHPQRAGAQCVAARDRDRAARRDRKSVVSGKSVSVRVDLGGRRIITKKTTKEQKTYSKKQTTRTTNLKSHNTSYNINSD